LSNKCESSTYASDTAKIKKITAKDTSTDSTAKQDENSVDNEKLMMQIEEMILDDRVNDVKNLEDIVIWINSKTAKYEKGIAGIMTTVYENANTINEQINLKIKDSMSDLNSIQKETENAKKLCQGLVNKSDKDIGNIKKD
jgi:hypothetical protein